MRTITRLIINDMERELKRLWKVETRVIQIVVGALRTIPKDLEKNLKRKEGTTVNVELLQKAALLGTAQILRKVGLLHVHRIDKRNVKAARL